MPRSSKIARSWLIRRVRLPTSRERARCSVCRSSCAASSKPRTASSAATQLRRSPRHRDHRSSAPSRTAGRIPATSAAPRGLGPRRADRGDARRSRPPSPPRKPAACPRTPPASPAIRAAAGPPPPTRQVPRRCSSTSQINSNHRYRHGALPFSACSGDTMRSVTGGAGHPIKDGACRRTGTRGREGAPRGLVRTAARS